MPAPLKKVRVLDFSHLLPGELCSTILSDMGCDVVRVEALKPGLAQRLPPLVKGESLYYWSIHRDKQRLRLNLKHPEGQAIARRLAGQSDVVLENFRPGVMTRLGLGYKHLRRINSRLIYCSISGYGQTSAWSQKPGHDLNYIAESGILSLNRRTDGPPVLPGVLISDFLAAVYAALAVAGALHERQLTGRGKCLDISMFECALSTMNILATALLYTGQLPEGFGFTYQTELPNYNVYECADGRYLAVASLEPQFWEGFCQVIERPDLVATFHGGPNSALRQELARIIHKRSLSEWMAVFDQGNCCVSPVHTLEEALSYLPVRERGVITHLVHPILGKVPQLVTPTSAKKNGSATRSKNGSSAERASSITQAEDPVRILRSLGYSRNKIQRLSEENVIALL